MGASTDTSEIYTGDMVATCCSASAPAFTLRFPLRGAYLADTLSYAYLAYLRADVALAQPSAFVVDTGSQGLTMTETNIRTKARPSGGRTPSPRLSQGTDRRGGSRLGTAGRLGPARPRAGRRRGRYATEPTLVPRDDVPTSEGSRSYTFIAEGDRLPVPETTVPADASPVYRAKVHKPKG